MTNLRNLVAISATAALVAIGHNVIAQDDLDDLLKDLGDTPVVAEPAAEEPAVAEEPAAEEPVAEPEEPVVAEEPVVEPEEPAVAEEPVVEPEEPAVAEEPAVEEPTVAAEEPAVVPEEPAVAEEPVAEPEEPAVAEEPAVEEPVAAATDVIDTINDLAAEEPATEEPVVAVEDPAPAVEDPAPAVEEPNEEPEDPEEPAPVAEDSVGATEEPAPAAVPESVEEPAPVGEPDAAVAVPVEDAELIAQLAETRKLSLKAYALQAQREFDEAQRCVAGEEFVEAAKHYAQAVRLLNDSPRYADMRRQCEAGIADSLYNAAMQEDATGRRDRAMKLMEKAVARRHPKARRQLRAWQAAGDPDANKTDVSEIKGRRNDADYKALRLKNKQHLKRAQQFLSSRELDKAQDECGLVLLTEPYNQEAIRIKRAIEKKRHTIMKAEREAARDGMIADVDKAWRPIYAVDAREVDDVKETRTRPLDATDPERTTEQAIIKRMKDMILPMVEFKPPTTIIEAVEFFRQMSKEYDRPDIPDDQRGFNFFFKPPRVATRAEAVEEESSGFGAEDDGASAANPELVIPMIAASNISFYDALKLVCESVNYKFKVQNSMIVVLHQNEAIDEMITRSYPVLSSFSDKMASASNDISEMRQGGFGGALGSTARRGGDEGDEESEELKWKSFFKVLGVEWPEGSQIMYIKTIGKLRVKNTYENIAAFEEALKELRVEQRLIEIEARFVEVSQDDLNSLGFEWILNSDYTLGLGRHASQALGLRRGTWGSFEGSSETTESWDSKTLATAGSPTTTTIGGVTTTTTTTVPVKTTTYSGTRTVYARSNGAGWIRNGNGRGNVGISGMGGDSEFTGGANRYLSTLSNHISGESKSTNDKFMKVNAFLGAADLSMILHMLSQRSDTDLLSAPKVLSRSEEEAVIKVVTEYIYPTDYDVQLQSSSSSGGGYGGGGSQSAILAVVEPQSFTMREVGVILRATPRLMEEGNLIDLHIEADVVDEPTWKNYGMRIPFTGNSSALQNFTGIGEILGGLSDVLTTLGTGLTDNQRQSFAESAVNSATTALDSLSRSGQDENITYYDAPMEQPFFHTRSINSNVTMYPGSTIVMGGLITEHRKAMDDKIPVLGDIPFIGRLFRSHSEMSSKRNLLIFVTTRLLDMRGREVTMSSSDVKEPDAKAAPEEEE